mmetsp:Transcript_29188/g.96797  ORF Transcript_29188/g.96797 Transcript_29188/m.96797 type:complete len:258 (-) Transcript_29188:71-844(-)
MRATVVAACSGRLAQCRSRAGPRLVPLLSAEVAGGSSGWLVALFAGVPHLATVVAAHLAVATDRLPPHALGRRRGRCSALARVGHSGRGRCGRHERGRCSGHAAGRGREEAGGRWQRQDALLQLWQDGARQQTVRQASRTNRLPPLRRGGAQGAGLPYCGTERAGRCTLLQLWRAWPPVGVVPEAKGGSGQLPQVRQARPHGALLPRQATARRGRSGRRGRRRGAGREARGAEGGQGLGGGGRHQVGAQGDGSEAAR